MARSPNPIRRLFSQGAFFGTLITVAAALLLTVVLILVNAPDAALTLRAFFIGPWSSRWFLGNTLDSISLLLTASLGAALAFRGGCFNLGGEGQIYLGGLAASVVLLSGEGTAGGTEGGILCLAALAALLTGGSLGAIAAFLKRKFGAHELISSFLLSAALSPLADYLITGPLRDPQGNLLATSRFAPGRLLPRLLPPSALSLSFIFALILIAAGYVFIHRSLRGYRFRIAGAAADFARYGGIRPEAYWIPAMTLSGALSALTGFFAVAGTYGLCHRGFSGGLGWNAIAVALIARNYPLALFPAALVYGALKAGSDAALLAAGLSFETSAFIQTVVLLLATVHFAGPLMDRRHILRRGAALFRRLREKRRLRRKRRFRRKR
ncbi:MAG: ABC transporter permease [Spirochaetaceae bacterium]|jgi:simple sugar transport system permease protein|nr:ABC transporter permease [Spirochaetaceae bacterium]